jgi:hypothetical protein
MTVTAAARRRWLLLPAIGVAVLGLHVAALSLLAAGRIDDAPTASALPRLLRSVVLMPVAAAAARTSAPTSNVPPPSRTLRGRAAPAVSPPETLAPTVPPGPPAVALVTERPALAPAAATESEPDRSPSVAPGGIEVPVYATRMPPFGRWRYRLQRGPAIGEAELLWSGQPEGRYALRLEGRAAGATLLEWASQGTIDAAGVAPERFAVRRRGRYGQAANFQREAGKITFSGPTHEVPLLPGAQDRLSWMVQLPAIVAAAPERFGAGTHILLFVAGARGDADLWTFNVQGIEMLGDIPALKLVREPRKLYDTRVEVWLDAADHHMPVRAVQTPVGGGVALDMQRERNSP